MTETITMQHGFVRIAGAPEGHDVRLVAALAQQAYDTARAPVLQIVRDDMRLYTLRDLYAFLAPDIQVHFFPAWDCLPYDRVSPHHEIIAERVSFLTDMANQKEWTKPTVILAPIKAAVQRITPLRYFENASFDLSVGKTLDHARFRSFLTDQGYRRSDTVRESGEFAIRGSIVDVFPAGATDPVRIDCFDDEIETIKTFDPMEQTSLETISGVSLKATSEIVLNKETIAHFRARYRELFGAQQSDDPLFEAVSEGHRYPGMEHWLPLFYPETVTLFDLVPERTPIVWDHQIETVYQDRMAQIIDFYNSRTQVDTDKKNTLTSKYKAIAPPLFFLMEDDWKHLEKRPVRRELSPFPTDETQARQAPNLSVNIAHDPASPHEKIRMLLVQSAQAKKHVVLACYSEGSIARIKQLCEEHNVPIGTVLKNGRELRNAAYGVAHLCQLTMEHGFDSSDLIILTEQDFLGDRLTRAPKRRKRNESALTDTSQLNQGDLVVHIEHGVGKFDGLITLTVDGVSHDCVRILYADNDKLFVPVESLDVLSRFGSDNDTTNLDKLGGVGWQARKARVKKRLLEMAEGLIAIAAQRKLAEAPDIAMTDGAYHEFVSRFPYQETEDQERSIQDVLNDLYQGRVMDRLVCGDVGFGKTEVAMRAAFVAAMAGLQVAVAVPTTLLARQHFANFTKRFAGFPLKIGQISRMVTTKQANHYRDLLEKGQLDIVIGTHALLSDKVKFKDLGLLIIDEEQNFGVKQKEKLKQMRQNVHVLTLTATPIPRTLQLAMTGIRDLSLIATPPVDRLAVRTSVMPFDPVIIREAIMREYYRGGQCFYVVPRLADMKDVQEMLAELVPEIRIVHAHGQMSATELDERMTAFYEGKYHLLLATNIIESGLDIANANTLIVHRSDLFGLSQLYQIRGRVGRSKQRGYAYFTYKDEKLLSERAKQRLHVIGTLDTLGAGFQLAIYDMDIRGAGNLLGEEQSGHIREVGVELYQQMLEEAVQAVRSGQGWDTSLDDEWTPTINLGMPVLIPDSYVTDLPVRLSLYRRLASLTDQQEIDAFAVELVDRFGAMPDEVKNLLDVITIKALCKKAGIEKVDAGPKGAVVTFRRNEFGPVDQLLSYVQKQMGTVKLRPDHKLGYMRAWDDVTIRMKGVRGLASDLAAMVA